jgi:hypothetical protein
MSRVVGSKHGIPVLAVLGDGVEHGQRLAHARHPGDFLALAAGQALRVTGLEDGAWRTAVSVAM